MFPSSDRPVTQTQHDSCSRMFYFTRQNNANIVHVDLMASDGHNDMFVGDEDHYGELGERRERLQ